MVTWGENQTITYSAGSTSSASAAPPGTPGAPAPAAAGGFGFGATTTTTAPSTPAPGGFGSTTFGSTSTSTSGATGGGGLFGGNPAPAFGGTSSTAGGSLFGSSSTAPSSSIFGAPSSGGFGTGTSGTGLFGAPAPSTGGGLFGGTTTSSSGGLFAGTPSSGGLFGVAATPQQQLVPQIPAQAAYQAHQDAQARQMDLEFNKKIQEYEHMYNGTMPATSETQSAPFTTVLFNPASSDYQTKVWLVQGNTGNPEARPVLDRPAQLSVHDWELGCLRAPAGYEPVAAVGANALQTRIVAQQEQANQVAEQIKLLQNMTKQLDERMQDALREGYTVKHNRLHKERRQRLWRIMQKVELIRCINIPLQKDEAMAFRVLSNVGKGSDAIVPYTGAIPAPQGMPRLVTPDGSQPVDPKQVKHVMDGHHEELRKIIEMVNKDTRDVQLLKERLQK